MAGEDFFQPFLQECAAPRAEGAHAVPVGGVGEEALLFGVHEGQESVIALIVHIPDTFPGCRAHADHAHGRRTGKAFLGSAEEEVDVPFVSLHGASAEGRHGVHVEEGNAQIFFELSQRGQGIEGARGCLAVHGGYHYGMEALRRVLHALKRRIVNDRVVGLAHELNPAAQGPRHVSVAIAKKAGPHAEHGISGPEAALHGSPEGQHAFAAHDDHIVLRAHEAGELP